MVNCVAISQSNMHNYIYVNFTITHNRGSKRCGFGEKTFCDDRESVIFFT